MHRRLTRRAFLSMWSLPWTTARKVALVAFFGQFILYLPALTPYWQERGLSLAQISSLQALLAVVGLLLDVPTGVLADRIGRRWTYRAALACQALGQVLFLLARAYWMFALSQVFVGTAFALASGSIDALVYESLPAENRSAAMQRAKGAIGASYQLASVIAFVAGGVLVADLRLTHIILAIQLTILSTLIACAVTFFVPESGKALATHRPRAEALLRDGVRLLRHNRRLQWIVLVTLLTDAFPGYLLVLYQPYLLHAGAGGLWLGVALGLGSVFALFGQRYAYALEVALGRLRAALLVTAAPGVLYLLMAAAAQPVLAVLLFCMQWGAIPVKVPLFSAYMNVHIPTTQRATVLSLVNTLLSIYTGLMGLVIGRIADASLPVTFVVMGVLVLGGALLLRLNGHVGSMNLS